MPRYADMFVDLTEDPRADPPGSGDERATLLGFLAWQRRTLELKCAGLTPERLARRSLEPSMMSLLGLVRHLADVERGWIRRGLAKHDAPRLFPGADEDFTGAVADPAVVDHAWEVWRAEAAFTDSFAREAPMDVSLPDADRGPLSLRWVLVHLVEEYARHNGHADILRERIDGRVGQ
ncbi:DinB family protein [Virgisporangium ochraceum]